MGPEQSVTKDEVSRLTFSQRNLKKEKGQI